MSNPANEYIWVEDTETYVKHRMSVEDFAARIAEIIIDRIGREMTALEREKGKQTANKKQ